MQVRTRDINVALPLVLQVLMFTGTRRVSRYSRAGELSGRLLGEPAGDPGRRFPACSPGWRAPNVGRPPLLHASAGVVFFFLAYGAFKRLEAKIVDEM